MKLPPAWARAASAVTLVAVTAGLSACGGGSDEPAADLYVTYEYPVASMRVALFDTIRVAPVLAGLGGHAPHFRVDTTIHALPKGFSLSPTDGTIGGYAGVAGSHPISAVLTVDGFSSSLTQTVAFEVATDIVFAYAYDNRVPIGQPIAPVAPSITGLAPGDAVGPFRLLGPGRSGPGSLPPGLVMDAQTGVISGTPTTAGTFTAFVEATVTRDGKAATIQSTSYLYFAI